MDKDFRDFSGVEPEAAWAMHGQFQEEMRNLREEEYRLADLYMKITTFTGGAFSLILLTTWVSYSTPVLAGAIVALVFYAVLLVMFACRIRKNHHDYRKLAGWVVNIRENHACEAFPSAAPGDIFGQGRGYIWQLFSLAWCWGVVTLIMVLCLTVWLRRPGDAERDSRTPRRTNSVHSSGVGESGNPGPGLH